MPRKDARRSAQPPSAASALEALRALYARVDEAFAGWSCPASTECCRFGVTGREPYVTSVELAALRKAVAARGGPGSWRPAPPLANADDKRRLRVADGERRCPLLDASGRCAAYQARPFGCRTFFCDRAERGERVPHAAVTAFVRELQAIAAAHEPGGDQGRPLTRAW